MYTSINVPILYQIMIGSNIVPFLYKMSILFCISIMYHYCTFFFGCIIDGSLRFYSLSLCHFSPRCHRVPSFKVTTPDHIKVMLLMTLSDSITLNDSTGLQTDQLSTQSNMSEMNWEENSTKLIVPALTMATPRMNKPSPVYHTKVCQEHV